MTERRTRSEAPPPEGWRGREETLYREGKFERAAVDEQKRTAVLSFSSETPVTRWGDREILSHDEDAVDLGRLRELGVLLWNHSSDAPIGRIESVGLERRRGTAVVRFDEDEESERIWRKVLSGTLRGVSVGYRVSSWAYVEQGHTLETVGGGRFEGECYVGLQWEPLEVSIVSVPADASVGVGRNCPSGAQVDHGAASRPGRGGSDEGGRNVEDLELKREQEAGKGAGPVKEEIRKKEETAPQKMEQVREDSEGVRQQERTRCAEVAALCREYGLDEQGFLASGAGPDEVRKAALEKLTKERIPVGAQVTEDERDKFRCAAVDGLALRAGVRLESPASGHEAFRGCSLMDLARECLARSGERPRLGADRMEIARRAIGSSDFPLLLSDAANRVLQASFESVPTTWQLWAGTGEVPDFKEMSRLRLSEAPDIELIPEHGEYKMAQFSEGRVTYRIATYGKKFALTRQAIVNDDLGALTRIPGMFGRSAKRKINQAVYGILNANPALDDGVALFHASHGNLAASGAAVSIATLDTGRVAMMSQTGMNGLDKLGIRPRFLLVPVGRELMARQLMLSQVDPGKNNGVPNPVAGMFQVISDPDLTDPNAWFLAAGPGEQVDTVEAFFLDGVQTPVLEHQESWDYDGIEYRTRIDFGAKCLDHRGLYKNAGA